MSQAEPWTIGRLLQWTTEHLKKQGSESPRLDAEVLLASARGCKRIELYTSFEEVASDALRTTFRDLVRRRAEGTPVAYLVGQKEFYSLPFRVTSDVLIPRPETELLVVQLLDRLKQRRQSGLPPARVVDVGTGSGIIAVCAAKYSDARIAAVDVSEAALAIARGNAEVNGVAERIEFREGDLLAPWPAEPAFDFVVSNPPYIKDAELDELAVDVRKYEPRLALAGGQEGTEVIARLIPQAHERLTSGGVLLMEISPMIEKSVLALLEQSGGRRVGPAIKDLAGLARVVVAQKQ